MYGSGVVTLRLFKWISPRWNFAMHRGNMFRETLADAEAVLVRHENLEEVLEHVGDDTTVFAPSADDGFTFDLIENGEIATQVEADSPMAYETLVSVWEDPIYGLVCEGRPTGPSTESEKNETPQSTMHENTFEAIDDELKTELNDADVVLIDYRIIHWVTEYIGEDTLLLSRGPTTVEYDLIRHGTVATQLNTGILKKHDDVISVWLEPGYGLVRAETVSDDTDTLPKDTIPDDPATRERSARGTIQPVEDGLSYDTLRAVMAVVEGYEDAHPEAPVSDLDDYHRGRYEAFSAMSGVLSRWLVAIRQDRRAE